MRESPKFLQGVNFQVVDLCETGAWGHCKEIKKSQGSHLPIP